MKVRNTSGVDRVAEQRLVVAGATLDVAHSVYGVTAYTQQLEVWEPFDDEAKAAHDEMLGAIAYLLDLTAEREEAADEVREDAAEAVADEHRPDLAGLEPSGGASREAWVAFVTEHLGLTEDDLDGMSRDEIRDTYTSKEK